MTEPLISYLWAAQVFASGLMTGLVWFVQINHYPLFLRISSADFPEYEKEHVRRPGWIVAPTMLVELGACLALAYFVATPWFLYGNSTLVLSIWLSTFLVQMPLHGKLQRIGKDEPAIRLLITSNWYRTVAWTLIFGGLILQAP